MIMQTKEHLLYFFLSKSLRLHYSDRKFFNNITTIIRDSKSITTGQAALFDLLIEKYESQLKGTLLTKDQLLTLPWKSIIVQTSASYTSARVVLVNGNIMIKVPMNNKFIKKFEQIKDITFKWNKQSKSYISPFSTFALKTAYSELSSYFPSVVYCNKLEEILAPVKALAKEELNWDPTLVKINNNYYVISVNETVGDLIKDLPLNDDPVTLYKLSQLGISIHPDIADTDIKKFASKFMAEVDADHFTELSLWLRQLGVEHVLLGKGLQSSFHNSRLLFKPMLQLFDEHDIKYTVVSNALFRTPPDIKKPILLQYHGNESRKFFGYGSLGKCVFIKNSRPIEIK